MGVLTNVIHCYASYTQLNHIQQYRVWIHYREKLKCYAQELAWTVNKQLQFINNVMCIPLGSDE